LQFPQFNSNNLYKTRTFKDQDEVMDLLYAIDYSQRPVIRERDIKIIVLPKGNNLSASDIEDFFENRSPTTQAEEEVKLTEINKLNLSTNLLDSLFEPIIEDIAENIIQFDFIFSKANSSGPDVDLVELSGLERSFLANLSHRVQCIRYPLQEERESLYPHRPKEFEYLDIKKAFFNILGDVTKDKKKYQNHLFKVLPQIYTGTYYRDDVLLPAFIEKTEYNIRQNRSNFNLLKFDYFFLTQLLNSNGDRLMEEMKNSQSYQVGLLLGKMARPLDRKINSFEKNYVGLLSRRISDQEGLIKLANFINEKLAIHNVAYLNLKQAFVQLARIISEMPAKDYHKSYCAFGFFESYYTYEKSEQDSGTLADSHILNTVD
ncbi:MAG: hypothetical protein AB1489_31940, partial [Acidobacteriota bacterium]